MTKYFDIKTPFKGNGWFKIKVKDKTFRILSNGTRIITTENAHRQIAKI